MSNLSKKASICQSIECQTLQVINTLFLQEQEREQEYLIQKMQEKESNLKQTSSPTPYFNSSPLLLKQEDLNYFPKKNDTSSLNQQYCKEEYCEHPIESNQIINSTKPLRLASFSLISNTSKQIEVISQIFEQSQQNSFKSQKFMNNSEHQELNILGVKENGLQERFQCRERSRSLDKKKLSTEINQREKNKSEEGNNDILDCQVKKDFIEKQKIVKLTKKSIECFRTVTKSLSLLKQESKSQISQCMHQILNLLSKNKKFIREKNQSCVSASIVLTASRMANVPFGLRTVLFSTSLSERNFQKVTIQVSNLLQTYPTNLPEDLFPIFAEKVVSSIIKEDSYDRKIAEITLGGSNYIYQNASINGLIQGINAHVVVGSMVLVSAGLNYKYIPIRQLSQQTEIPIEHFLEHIEFLISHCQLLLNNSSLFKYSIEDFQERLYQN